MRLNFEGMSEDGFGFTLRFSRRYSMAHRLLSGVAPNCRVPHGHDEVVTVDIVESSNAGLDGKTNMLVEFEQVKGRWFKWIDKAVDHSFHLGDGDPLVACPVCKVGVIKLRNGEFGQFRSCSTWPRCDFKAESVDEEETPTELHRIGGKVLEGAACPTCKTGSMIVVKGRHGEFLGCSGYPRCKTVARYSAG